MTLSAQERKSAWVWRPLRSILAQKRAISIPPRAAIPVATQHSHKDDCQRDPKPDCDDHRPQIYADKAVGTVLSTNCCVCPTRQPWLASRSTSRINAGCNGLSTPSA